MHSAAVHIAPGLSAGAPQGAVPGVFGPEHIPADHVLRDHQCAPAQLVLEHMGKGGLAAAGVATEQDEFVWVLVMVHSGYALSIYKILSTSLYHSAENLVNHNSFLYP